MLIKIDRLESQIETDNPKLLKALSDLYSVTDKNARYVPAYKRGFWDGKKRFLSATTGKFGTGLLPRVLRDLSKLDDLNIELDYLYEADPPQLFDFTLEGWDFRDYQSDYVQRALSDKRCVIQAPTGAGKTLMMAAIIKALGKRKIIVLFNQKQLLEQTYRYLTDPAPKGVDITNRYGISVGVAYGEGFEYGDVMLTSVFSLEKIIGTPHESAEVLMVDEVHEFCTGKLTSGAIKAFPMAEYRYGFTATPPRDQMKALTLESAIGPTIQEVTTKQLIEDESLAKPFIHVTPISCKDPEIEFENCAGMSYAEVYDKYIVHNNHRNRYIREICENIENGNVLLLVQSLDHAHELHSLIPNSYQIEGQDCLQTRKKAIKDFLDHDGTSVLIGTRILQTGINIPEITHLINARGLKSEVATIQALGRSLRKSDVSKHIQVYDFMDNPRYLENHSVSRLRHYKREGHDIEILDDVEYHYEG